MNKYIFLLVSGFCAFFMTSMADAAAIGMTQPIDKIVAIVNDSVITTRQLNNQVAQIKQRMKKSGSKEQPDPAMLRRQVLEQMINRELELQQAKQMGVQVTSEQLKQALMRIAKGNHMTLNQLYASARSQGFTRREFQQEIKTEILTNAVETQAVGRHINISQKEVNDFVHILNAKNNHGLSQYHIVDVLVPLPDSPTPEQIDKAKLVANNAVKLLRSQHDINAVLKQYSELQRHDLGWRKLAELPTPFVQPLEHMKKGMVSNPIHTANGFHILTLLNIKSDGDLSNNPKVQRQQVEKMLYDRDSQELTQNWLAQLRAQAYIKIVSDAL